MIEYAGTISRPENTQFSNNISSSRALVFDSMSTKLQVAIESCMCIDHCKFPQQCSVFNYCKSVKANCKMCSCKLKISDV